MVNLFKKLKPVLSLLLVIVIIFGVAFLFSPKTKQKSRLIYEQNVTEIAPDAVHPGDFITINYELSIPDENYKIIDTNNVSIAKKLRLKTFTEGPYRLIAGKSGKVKGFDDAFIGMKVGESKDIIIPPSEPPTIYVINTTRSFSRNQPVPRDQVFSMASFEKLFGKNHAINDLVSNAKFPWKYKILNMSSLNVGVEAMVSENDEFVLPGLEWKSRVLMVSDYDFLVRHNPTEGQTIASGLGKAVINLTVGKIIVKYNVTEGELVNYSRDVMGIRDAHVFKVVSVDDKRITLQRDDNPAEKTLRLKVTLLNRLPIFNKNQ